MKCPECGIELSEFYKFCSHCGAIISTPIDLRDSALNEPREQIMRAITKRSETDRRIPSIWMVILAVAYLIGIIVYFAAIISAMWESAYDPLPDNSSYVTYTIVYSTFTAIINIFLAIIAFLLVQRINRHFSRDRELRSGIVDLVRSAALRTRKYDSVATDMMWMETNHNPVEKQREPGIWAVFVGLAALPSMYQALAVVAGSGSDSYDISFGWFVAGSVATLLASLLSLVATLYLLYFLSKDLYDHDGRWNSFSLAARTAMTKLGFPKGSSFEVSRVTSRSPVLYIVLSLFIPFFVYYWWYAVVKDPNEHFDVQNSFENHLMSVIRA